MSPELRSLGWKEWRERKWSLALCGGWIVCGVAYAATNELLLGYRAPVGSFYSTCLLYGLVAALFLSMRTALGETTQVTIGFSSALPVSLRRIAAVRLCGAALTLAGPIILGALLLSLVLLTGLIEQAPARPPHTPGMTIPSLTERPSLASLEAVGLLWKVTAAAIASGGQLLLILCTIGARRRAEAHLGFIGAFVTFVWFLGIGLRHSFRGFQRAAWVGTLFPQSLVLPHSYDLELADLVWLPLAVNLLVLTALGAWFARRYGTKETVEVEPHNALRRWGLPALLSRLPLRWPGRAAALVWLDLRQALPLAAAGLALACVMTIANIAFDDGFDRRLPEMVLGQLPGGTWIVVLLWGAVVGSGTFAAEVQPGLGHFWRSRPISPTIWFWVKYTVGLIAVLGVLDGVTILVSWNSPYASGPARMSRSYVACMPILHTAVYSLAVLAVSLLRRPVVAGALAVGTDFLISHTLQSIPLGRRFEALYVYNELHRAELNGVFDLTSHHYPLVYGMVAATAVMSAVLAWRATLRH